MKLKKTYCYKYKFLKYIYSNENLLDEAVLSINIQNIGKKNYEVFIYLEDELLTRYIDNGEMMYFLKGLGKIFLMSTISFDIPAGNHIVIADNYDYSFGISKINTLNNDFIIIGGFDKWSTIINIDGFSREQAIEKIIESILDYSDNYGFCDFKTMYILIDENVAKFLGTDIFVKPYIYLV